MLWTACSNAVLGIVMRRWTHDCPTALLLLLSGIGHNTINVKIHDLSQCLLNSSHFLYDFVCC